MHTRQERHQHAAHHHEVEVRHDEVRLRQVDIHAERAKEYACETANGEQSDEPEGVQHRSLKRDRTLLQRERPIEYLDG